KNILSNREFYFYQQYGTAISRIKAQLNYKIGLEILDFLKNKQNFFILIKKISFLIKEDKKQKEIYKQAVQNDPSLKLPSLELYPDYKEAAKIQNHLSYKLGEAFLKCYKSKYKISYIKLPWNIFKAWKEFDK
ncbi:alpha-2,3-sialyltransferase, partial [Campylobacter jejuni]